METMFHNKTYLYKISNFLKNNGNYLDELLNNGRGQVGSEGSNSCAGWATILRGSYCSLIGLTTQMKI